MAQLHIQLTDRESSYNLLLLEFSGYNLLSICIFSSFKKRQLHETLVYLHCATMLPYNLCRNHVFLSCRKRPLRTEPQRQPSDTSSNGQILSNTSTTSALRSHIRNHSISLLVQNNDNTDNMYQITDYKNTSSQPATIVHSYLADRHERKITNHFM